MVAVNIVDKQDDQVVPFLTQHRFTFRAYRPTLEMLQAYGVRGAPTEYVLDRRGRVVAQVRLNSDANEQRFVDLVEGLLR